MARLTNGALGGFSGKVGSVVGCRWKDVDYIRSLPRVNKKRKPTPAQVAARAKFTFLNTWLKKLTSFVAVGFNNYSGRMTGMQAAHSCNAKAVTGVYPDFSLDFSVVKVSHGDLQGANDVTVMASAPGELHFSWSPDIIQRKAHGDDQAMLLAYVPEKEVAFYTVGGAHRAKGMDSLEIGHGFSGTAAEVYVAFISYDRKRISESQYIGQVSLL